MKHIKTLALAVITGLALLGGTYTIAKMTTGVTATAQTSAAKSIVDNAIEQGIVGETASGYLALTGKSSTSQIVNAMNEINAGRKAVYTQLARQQNVQIEIVAALTGEKQLASAKPGTMVLTKQGQWIKVR